MKKYLLIGDIVDYEINLGTDDKLVIMQLESMLDSVIDTYKSYGLDVEELIDNLKSDCSFDDDEIKEV